MKLPSLRKIFSSDFSAEFKALADQIGILFNGGLEPLYDALNNKLTFRDNFNATVTEFTVTVNGDGTPRQATSFKLAANQTTIDGIFAINAAGGADGSILPSSGIFISFAKNGNSVTIRNVKGLETGVQYRIKVVCLA